MSAENDVLFPYSETMLFGDQFSYNASHYEMRDQESLWKETALDGLSRADLLHDLENGHSCESPLSNSHYDIILPTCEDEQAGNLLSEQPKFNFNFETLFALSETENSGRPQPYQSSVDITRMNVNSDMSCFDSNGIKNDVECLSTAIEEKAKTSSLEAILAAKRLNYLSLRQIVHALDMKEEVNGSSPDEEIEPPATSVPDAASQTLLLSSPDLSSRLLCTSEHSAKIPSYSSYASDVTSISTVRMLGGTGCNLASGASSLVPISDDFLHHSSLNGSADAKIEIGDVIQQRNIYFHLPKNLSYSSGIPPENDMLVPSEDLTGDELSPLPISVKSSLRPHPIQRSFSSHTLGQMVAMTAAQEASRLTSEPVDGSESILGCSQQTVIQPHPSELQEFNRRPMMPFIRRVYSTGDIQTFGRGSMFVPDCSGQEAEGSFKVGRYTSEERKVRISRYRQKRAERNFNKKIKYVCRKTLADNRPRVRGRFAKNDDPEPKTGGCKLPDHEDDGEGDQLLDEEDLAFDEDPCPRDTSYNYMLRTNSYEDY